MILWEGMLMKRRWFLWSFVLTLILPLAAQTDRTVVIVSWDGGKPSVIRQLTQQGKLPTVQALMSEGSYTLKAQTIVPSSTLQSHASMLTGLSFERHGVNWNTYKPELGFVKVPTVFELAKKAGLKTAMVFSKEKLKHLAKPKTVDAIEYISGDAHKVADVAVHLLNEVKPQLLFVHFSDPDSTGHRYGWGNEKKGELPSAEFLVALQRCDDATSKIVSALKRNGRWQRTLLIITADHGGHDKTHGSADPEDVLIPWIASGGLTASKGELTQTVRTMDTASTVLAALGIPIPSDWDGKPILDALSNGGKTTMNGKPLQILAEWKGAHSGITQLQRKVITSAKDWEKLWQEVHRNRIPIPPVPKLDFERQMVLATFMGERQTGGYTIQITKVVAHNGEVVAHVRETVPPKGAIVIQVLTQPYHIVVVPKVNAPIRFVTE